MITMTKRRNPTPTMRNRRRSNVLLEADKQSVDKLIREFGLLEREWNSFNSSKPRPLRRSSSDAIVETVLQLLNNSPRSLMYSLQNRARTRNNDAAREEIIRDRKAARESGKLKGRRLFEEAESETEVGFGEREEISSVTSTYCANEGKGSYEKSKGEVVSGNCVCRCSGSSSLSDEKGERGEAVAAVVVVGEEKKVVGVNVELLNGDEISFVSGGGRWMAMIKLWFYLVLLAFAVGFFFMRCNGGYGDKDEVMLVPT